MTILLYDLVFNVACFFHECHFFVYLVASVLYSHVVMGAISMACEQAPLGRGWGRNRGKDGKSFPSIAPPPPRELARRLLFQKPF